MAYYDKIAAKWHKTTGFKGGSFKEFVLNEKVISKINNIESKTILEIGIGNGYFMPLLIKKKSGQKPERILLTDISLKNIEIAKKNFKVPNSKYQKLDLYKEFNIDVIDLVISNMVFNELKIAGIKNGITEIKRVLKMNGEFIISVLHPKFIEKQIEREVVKNNMMISKGGLKLPVMKRDLKDYEKLLDEAELNYETQDVYGNKKLFNMKPKLKEINEIPIGLIISGIKK